MAKQIINCSVVSPLYFFMQYLLLLREKLSGSQMINRLKLD